MIQDAHNALKPATLKVTIGVAARNEENTIGESIKFLLKEMNGLDSEIIVVAGGEDRTVEFAAEAISSSHRSTLVTEDVARGKPAALNLIRSAAVGEILFLTDGDVIVSEGSLKALLTAMVDPRVGAATGKVFGKPGKYNLVEKACDYAAELMDSLRMSEYQNHGTVTLASGYIMTVRRDLMPVIPEDAVSDDGYISAYVRSRGFRIAYVEEAEVRIVYPDNIADFLKQKSRTRYGHIQVGRTFPEKSTRRMVNEMVQHFGLLRMRGRPGIWELALSSSMIAFSWMIAYARHNMPQLFSGRVWVRIDSTKRL